MSAENSKQSQPSVEGYGQYQYFEKGPVSGTMLSYGPDKTGSEGVTRMKTGDYQPPLPESKTEEPAVGGTVPIAGGSPYEEPEADKRVRKVELSRMYLGAKAAGASAVTGASEDGPRGGHPYFPPQPTVPEQRKYYSEP